MKLRHAALSGLALFALIACQLFNLPAAPSPGSLPDFPAPQPPGLSPANPLPPGQPIQTGDWAIEAPTAVT